MGIEVPSEPQYSLYLNHHHQRCVRLVIQHLQGVVCELSAQEFGILRFF